MSLQRDQSTLVRIEEYQVTPLKNGTYYRPVGKRKTEKGAINLAMRYSALNPEFVFWIWHRNEGRIGWNSHGIQVQNGEVLR